MLTWAAVLLALTGCGEKKPVQARMPAPPPPIAPANPAQPQPEPSPAPPAATRAEGSPAFEEVGIASWYGPPYHNRRASNGEIYDMNALTAAHRTLPLGSVVRVTNLSTGRSTVVRITDRGPFVEGRVIDLSVAAAKAVDVWRPGLARVKLEVLEAPAPITTGGRWCVQIGALSHENARELKDSLSRRYHSAKILEFVSPVGSWWVRVRVADDDRRRAEQVARDTHPEEGSVFLVRLD